MKLSCLIIGLFGILSFSSCIQEEAPNAEADIVAVDSVWVETHLENNLLISKPVVENDKVMFLISKNADLTRLAPEFVLTPGASISPANGSYHDFTKPQYYTVTSADGMWKKEYKVSFVSAGAITSYRFEHWKYNNRNQYQIFYEISPEDNQQLDIWASGNGGFAFTGMAKSPEDYPTVSNDFGVAGGKCVKLETKSTGSFGMTVGMPIAAGNLFIGKFTSANALSSPLEATEFGMPNLIDSKPLALRGWYKYKAGTVFTDKSNQAVPGMKDACDIYAIVYEGGPDSPKLDGSNILSSDRVVCMARIENPGEPSEWTFFDIPFVDMNGKTFDYEQLKNNQYNVTIVFSSSIDGAYFNGAVGSTLYIDEVKLVCENN